jgi:hypothetical protein
LEALDMLYVLLILMAVVTATLLLRVRIRFEFGDSAMRLFVGLGRSGSEFNFARQVGFVKLCGRNIKRFEIGKTPKKKPKKEPKKPKKKKAAKAPSKQRRISFHELAGVLPKCVGPLWGFLMSLLKTTNVEELDGRIEAGFSEPHLTGTVFGYYQAALSAAPDVVGRVRYIPDWTGASFSGWGRVALALPLYFLAGRTVVLLWRLPLREIIKLAIGKKKGESDVQQCRRDTQRRRQRAA